MKRSFLFLILTFACLFNICHGQKIEKVIVSKNDTYKIYDDYEHADTSTLFYLKIVPKVRATGILVIIPASGDLVEDVMKQITLHKLALDKGFLVILPSINSGPNKLDQQCKFLDIIFKQIVEQYDVPVNKFVLGGLSGGGMISLRYAEIANIKKDSAYIIPRAVFALDPPVDYINLYYAEERDVKRNFAEAAVNEGKAYIETCKQEFGGTPKEVPFEYIKYSIYSHNEPDGGNAKYLINTPLLIYTEPGIEWQLKNRHRDLYDLNCTDLSAMVNFLQTHGNNNVQLVVTHDKGVRLNGLKHPHSWSIMDNEECIAWIIKQME